MCSTIYTGEGKEIETPWEFREHFGFDPPVSPFYDALHPESCLCPADLDKAFEEKGIKYRKEGMDYYLTEKSHMNQEEIIGHIKPLHWNQRDGELFADSSIGKFNIRPFPAPEVSLCLRSENGTDILGGFAKTSDAKTAAQELHNSEIRDFISPAPENKSIKPKHYKAGEQDVISFCQHHALNFQLGNVVKYVVRAGRKDASKHLEDLQKAQEYLRREIEFVKQKA